MIADSSSEYDNHKLTDRLREYGNDEQLCPKKFEYVLGRPSYRNQWGMYPTDFRYLHTTPIGTVEPQCGTSGCNSNEAVNAIKHERHAEMYRPDQA